MIKTQHDPDMILIFAANKGKKIILSNNGTNIDPDKILFKGINFNRVNTAIDCNFRHIFKHRNNFYQFIYIGE